VGKSSLKGEHVSGTKGHQWEGVTKVWGGEVGGGGGKGKAREKTSARNLVWGKPTIICSNSARGKALTSVCRRGGGNKERPRKGLIIKKGKAEAVRRGGKRGHRG